MPLTHSSTGAVPPVGGSQPIPWRVLMNFEPRDVWSEENGSAFHAAADAKDKAPAAKPVVQQRCRKLCLRLTKQQKRTLRLWMGAYRLTYNKAVELVQPRAADGQPQRREPRWLKAKCQYLNEQLVYESKNGRSSRVNKESTEEELEESAAKSEKMDALRASLGVKVGDLVGKHPWLKDVPTAIRKEACLDVAKAEKANEGRRLTKPGHRWTLKFKKRGDDSAWTMAVPVQCLLQAGVEPRPETRRPRRDGRPHMQQGRRDWTRVRMSELGDVWLTEALPDAALVELVSRGKRKREGLTLAKDCKITLDKRGRFHMVVPYEIEATPPTAKPAAERKTGAVDPGDRVNATVCSPDDGEVVSYAVGRENGGKDRVFREAARVDRLVGEARARKAEAGPTVEERARLLERIAPLKRERERVQQDAALPPEQREALLKRLRIAIKAMVAARYRRADGSAADSPSQARTRRRRMAVRRQKARDLVAEAHRKIALDMVRRWDTIILPPFNSHDMVKRPRGGRRRLSSRVARSLMQWRHYDFRLTLKSLVLREGKELASPDEKYTTMTCGVCGVLHVRHSDESWTCRHCGAFHQRDPAAARNIFIKPFDWRSAKDSVDAVRGRFQPTSISEASGSMTGQKQ
jgi:transposase